MGTINDDVLVKGIGFGSRLNSVIRSHVHFSTRGSIDLGLSTKGHNEGFFKGNMLSAEGKKAAEIRLSSKGQNVGSIEENM